MNRPTIRISIFSILIFCGILICTPARLNAQVAQFDTLYQTDYRMYWLNYADDYAYWFEFVDTNTVIYRLHNGELQSKIVPETYADCDVFGGLYGYGNFVYAQLGSTANLPLCNVGLVWEGDDFGPDPYDLGEIAAIRDGLILTRDAVLFDLNTKTKKAINLETITYRYDPYYGSINGPVVHILGNRYNKSTNSYQGKFIIQYHRETETWEEIFFSPLYLSFGNEYAKEGRIAFIESDITVSGDIPNLYFYDGETTHFIVSQYIINGYTHPYLNGLAYPTSEGLYYWENGKTALLSDDVYRLAVDDCKLFWFTGFRTEARMHILNGSTYTDFLLYNYPDETSLKLIADTAFVLTARDLEQTRYYLLRGTHGVRCTPCEETIVDIPADDPQTYLRTRSISSEAVIETGYTLYQAQESIKLLPGFQVAANSEFSAEIRDCDDTFSPPDPQALNRDDWPELRQLSATEGKPISTTKVAAVAQNIPNPFRQSTRIDYFVPEGTQRASIRIFNLTGRMVREIAIDSYGKGRITVPADQLSGGIYYYSLVVDGSIIATKKMIIVR